MRHDDIEHTLEHIRSLLMQGRTVMAGPRGYGFEVYVMPGGEGKVHLRHRNQPHCNTPADNPRLTTSPDKVTCAKCREYARLDA